VVACLPDSRAADSCGWFFTECVSGCDLLGPVLEFSVWLMELALGVSVFLLEGCFGGTVLWFVAGARLWMCGLAIDGDAFSHSQGDLQCRRHRSSGLSVSPSSSICPLRNPLRRCNDPFFIAPNSSLLVSSRPWEKKALDVLCPSLLWPWRDGASFGASLFVVHLQPSLLSTS
jgi:hypothetical protein